MREEARAHFMAYVRRVVRRGVGGVRSPRISYFLLKSPFSPKSVMAKATLYYVTKYFVIVVIDILLDFNRAGVQNLTIKLIVRIRAGEIDIIIRTRTNLPCNS